MCGIFGIINQKEELFDYQSFCTLGCANDRRGGDSCGIFIDGNVEYGIGNKALFENFFWTSELLNNTKTARIALGHDRKASTGMAVNLANAHPIVIYETVTDENGNSSEELKFVLVHNGTLYDYDDLAKKYIPDIEVKGMTDSQVIARLLYYAGYDWLAEYSGAAAFIAVDYRGEEPEVIIWRGESKKTSTSTEMEEERPLYCNLDNGRLVLCSIPSYLAIVDGECYMVPANEVLTYKNNSLYIIKKIDRSKATQSKKYEYGGYYRNNYEPIVAKYLRTVDTENTYKSDDKYLDGYIRLTIFGRILGKYDSASTVEKPQIIWFFNGIPLIDKKAYIFLSKAWKRTKFTIDEFTAVYQNLIRYFSVDKCYFIDKTLYQAIRPWTKILFTGYHQMLTTTTNTKYLLGVKQVDTKITTLSEGFEQLKNVSQFDYKTIWKEFIQSMG